jgi:amino acid permease
MKTIKKIISFLKSYWYVPLLIVVALVAKSRENKIKEILSIASDSHKKQMDAIKRKKKLKKSLKKTIMIKTKFLKKYLIYSD